MINPQKFYLSISICIIDFILFVFFVLQANKSSLCNILAFIAFLLLPVLSIWTIICLINFVKLYFKTKNFEKDRCNKNISQDKYKQYNYSYEKLPDNYFNAKAINTLLPQNTYNGDINQRFNKPKDYYSYIKKDNNQLNTEKYRKEHQEEYLAKLKVEFVEENNREPNFADLKHAIFAENEEDFDFHNDYNESGNREYFYIDNKWCFFDFYDEEYKYKLISCENKVFYTDCFIDAITNKTKKLIKFIKDNPTKTIIYEADLKSKDKILTTGQLIKCLNCNYEYYSDNKKCPNCNISTQENL